MRYPNIHSARFLDRPNRFIAHCEKDGEILTVHVKNTGRCRELLVPGVTVWLTHSDNPVRKTAWDLVAVKKGSRLINMDANAPNTAFGEFVRRGDFLPGLTSVRPEFTWGGSRFDFRLETENATHLVEVKGVTLEEDGVVRFPDAPTERGVKHLRELQAAVAAGMEAHAVFVIQMADVSHFEPNDATHPVFGQALREAAAAGVHLHAYTCRVTPETMELDAPVPIRL